MFGSAEEIKLLHTLLNCPFLNTSRRSCLITLVMLDTIKRCNCYTSAMPDTLGDNPCFILALLNTLIGVPLLCWAPLPLAMFYNGHAGQLHPLPLVKHVNDGHLKPLYIGHARHLQPLRSVYYGGIFLPRDS